MLNNECGKRRLFKKKSARCGLLRRAYGQVMDRGLTGEGCRCREVTGYCRFYDNASSSCVSFF